MTTTNSSATVANVQPNGTKWHDHYPYLGKEPVRAEVFTSEEQFALERERIFKKVWLNVGRVEQVPNTGDYFVKDIAVCQTSILVVRGAKMGRCALSIICAPIGGIKLPGISRGRVNCLPASSTAGRMPWMVRSNSSQTKRISLICKKRSSA